MSDKYEKVTFNKKATVGGDTPGEVKKKQKPQYSSRPAPVQLCILSFVLKGTKYENVGLLIIDDMHQYW